MTFLIKISNINGLVQYLSSVQRKARRGAIGIGLVMNDGLWADGTVSCSTIRDRSWEEEGSGGGEDTVGAREYYTGVTVPRSLDR